MESLFDFGFSLDQMDSSTLLAWGWWLLINGGWVFILGLFVRWLILKLWKMYVSEVQGHYAASVQKVTLSVRVPKQTEQTPKAVENIFAHLTGLYSGTGNFVDQYVHGKQQDNFAVEIITKDGVIQFLVHTPIKFKDVIEAAIFAQYPDAEIIQVPDYALEAPAKYPDDKYDLWGTELTLVKPEAYPIRTYGAFEHQLPGSFKDPIASLLEFMGTLNPTEQIWVQFVLMPTNDDWQKKSVLEVKKLIGAKVAPPPVKGIDKMLDSASDLLAGSINTFVPGYKPAAAAAPAKADSPNQIQYMTTGERVVVEQIEIKASKPGFASKIRIVYVAPKEIFNKGKVSAGIVGAFRQYAISNLNGFKAEPNSKVAAGYFKVAETIAGKQSAIMKNYVKRSSGGGGKPYILNVEELATLWHFPMIETKAPWITRSDFKRAEPPAFLPSREDLPRDRMKKPTRKAVEDTTTPAAAPAPIDDVPGNLPFA